MQVKPCKKPPGFNFNVKSAGLFSQSITKNILFYLKKTKQNKPLPYILLRLYFAYFCKLTSSLFQKYLTVNLLAERDLLEK